jgi:hypothetical protein
MIRTAAFFVLGAALVFAQDHQAMVNEHGDHVMGFSHEKTTHHFELNYDGGVIDVRANDVKDTESRDQIRGHFQHIAQMFAAGNFNAPMLVHGTNRSRYRRNDPAEGSTSLGFAGNTTRRTHRDYGG